MTAEDVRFDLYFTGQLVEGVDPATAQANLARLFRSTPEKMAGLFNGKPQRLKQGLNREEAQKYKLALTRAGLVVVFKSLAPAASEDAVTSTAQAAQDWSIAPAGSDLLRPEERHSKPALQVDTSGLSLASPFLEPVNTPRPSAAAPDTSHLRLAAVGVDLHDAPTSPPPPAPDTSALTLAPAGSDLEQLKPDVAMLEPDTSALSLAPPGSTVMPEDIPRPPPPSAPDTSHIRLTEDGKGP